MRRVGLHGFGFGPTQPAELGGGGAFGTEFARGCLFALQNQLNLKIKLVAGVETDEGAKRAKRGARREEIQILLKRERTEDDADARLRVPDFIASDGAVKKAGAGA